MTITACPNVDSVQRGVVELAWRTAKNDNDVRVNHN